MNLAEDVVSSSTPVEIGRAVAGLLPQALKAYDTCLYLYNRGNQTLDPILADGMRNPQSIGVQTELGGLASAVALTFRNRAMLVVPDTRNSPLFRNDEPELPPSAVFVPMLTHQEVLGVLMMTFTSHRQLGKDEQAAVQHVANQIATSLKLQEQKVMREQLLRSEKMAASGQLISGIATELRVPLQAVKTLADDLVSRAPGSPDPELRGIAFEADRAAGILSRLVSFASTEATQSQPVNLTEVVQTLVEFRRREWAVKGVTAEVDIPDDPIIVLGAQNQLEQVLLNLLTQAESSLDGKPERKIRIGAHRNGDDALVDIIFSDVGEAAAKEVIDEAAKSGALGLQVCQAILQSHGGEVKISPAPPLNSRFEIRLPAYESEEKAAERRRLAAPARPMTALIVEPDLAVQRRLMTLLSLRHHRSIPVATAEEGMDISHRLRFDVVFCAIRLPGLNWVEFQQRIRRNIPTFVLISEGFDPSLSKSFKPGEGFILGRALEEDEVERLLVTIESRQEATARR